MSNIYRRAYDFVYWIMPYLTIIGGIGLVLFFLLTDRLNFAIVGAVPILAGLGWIAEDKHYGLR